MKSGYDIRTEKRTVRKRCAKCGLKSWVRPRERKCKRMERNALGESGYWCYGALTPIAKKARPKTATDDEMYVAIYRRKTQAAVQSAEEALRRWIQKQRRAAVNVEEWTKAVEKRQRMAEVTDAQIIARRERARAALQVQQVRRRLQGKGRPETGQPTV
jgi:hypothetical protein